MIKTYKITCVEQHYKSHQFEMMNRKTGSQMARGSISKKTSLRLFD